MMDNTLHQINHYPADNMVYLLTFIHWIGICPLAIVIQPLNNWGGLFESRFSFTKLYFTAYVLYSLSLVQLKLKNEQYKQKTSPKSYKTQIKIFANAGLAYRALKNPALGPGAWGLVLLAFDSST